MTEFRWNEWNTQHLAEHGIDPEEVERIVRLAKPPYPQKRGDGKWAVWGQGQGGRFLQVIYILDEDSTIYVIHARPLTDHEKRRYRRRKP